MPDILKEMTGALSDAIRREIAKDARKRAQNIGLSGRLFGSDIAYGGGNGTSVDTFFATGYDSGSGTTTVAFIPGFSPVGGTDIVTS